jgi:tripartite-type tricarboxylate transporter receptor subunit TctC
MKRRDFLTAAVGLVAAGLLAGTAPAFAQEHFPNKPIRLVVPFSAGGPTDVFARKYADRVGTVLGQQVIIENKPGAGGMLGADFVAKSKPDGYTLLFGTTSTQTTGPLMMSPPMYDPINDFVLLTVGIVPMVLAVNPKVPANSLAEFVQVVKTNPGKYAFGSAGPGNINHLGGELFKVKAGNVDALHVPYKGTNLALVDTLAGNVHFLLDTFGTALSHHRSGALRILAVLDDKRSKVAPEIPTAAEQGLPDFIVRTINMVAIPAKAPAPVVAAIVAATRKVMNDEAFKAELEGMSIDPVTHADPEKSAEFFRKELAKWEPIVRMTGAKIE